MKTLLFFIFLMSGLPALAEEAGNDQNAKRSCRIIFPERPNDAPKLAYLFDGIKSHEVTLPSMNFSDVIFLPPGEITLLMTPDQVTESENPPSSTPTLTIPGEVRDFYIHVTPDPLNPTLPLRMELVDIGNGKLKPGETLWCNLTDHQIVAKLEGIEIIAPPNTQKVSKAPLPQNGYYRAEFTYQPDAKGDFLRITEQNWWHDAKSRHLGFIVNSGGRLPRIYFFRDFRL